MSLTKEEIKIHAEDLLDNIIYSCRAVTLDDEELDECVFDRIKYLKSVRPRSSKSQTRHIINNVAKNYKNRKKIENL